MSIKVPQYFYSSILGRLKQDCLPRTISMLGLLRNTQKGSIQANFYVDSWPQFSSLVCEQITPKLSTTNSIYCYTTCEKALSGVITERNLIAKNGDQAINVSDVSQQKSVEMLQNLMDTVSMKRRIKTYTIFTIPNLENVKNWNLRCPGYRIGRLHPQHSELVKSKWSVSQTSTTWIQQSIENLFSVAIFQEENPLEPVSWKMEYPNREIGYSYTLENHRGKMLSATSFVALCQLFLHDSPTTPIYTTIEGHTANRTMELIGLEKSGYMACC